MLRPAPFYYLLRVSLGIVYINSSRDFNPLQRKMVRGTLKSGMIVEELKKVVQKALKQEAEVVFEHPENPEHGDYSTNVALALGQKTGQNPKELAEGILSKVKSQKLSITSRLQAPAS